MGNEADDLWGCQEVAAVMVVVVVVGESRTPGVDPSRATSPRDLFITANDRWLIGL